MFMRMIGMMVAMTLTGAANAPKPLPVQNFGFKVVSVETSATGSGVFIDGQIMLTAAHVVAGEGASAIIECNGEEIEARVIKYSKGADLALLVLASVCPPAAVAHLSEVNPDVGTSVRIVGFPRGWRRTVNGGTVSAYEILTSDAVRFMMLVDGQVIGGNSGGPVLDEHRDLAGIVSSRVCLGSMHEDEPPVCYAGVIPVTTIRNFLMQNL